MTMISEYSFETNTWTHNDDLAQDQAWKDAVAEIAAKAKQTLPECGSRVERAAWLVMNGDVELLEGGKAKVRSQSNGTTKYYVVNGECTCKDYTKAPSHWCKHRIAYGIALRARTLTERKLAQTNGAPHDQAEACATPAAEEKLTLDLDPQVLNTAADTTPAAPAAQPDTAAQPQGIPREYLAYLHGKPFVRYVGLLAMAHERGLVQLTAQIEFHSDNLVLASATATLSDGRSFTEWADAMPGNVGTQVRPHWIRMALTRAKARALRDALAIGIAALEEIGDSE